jgi:hypothetical protein
MINKNIRRPGVRHAPPVNDTHIFAIGQIVRMKSGLPVPASVTAETFQITATLPPSGNSPQYRIRSEKERYERVTTQDNIELVSPKKSGSNSSLMERTFGHG